MVLPDDTQPRSPFKTPPRAQPPVYVDPLDEPPAGGPGCLVWGFIGVVGVGFAGLIIVLAALAGWTSGQRIAQMNATATQSAAINEQISRLSGDITGGNLILLQARLQYLATLTPGVPGLDGFVQTATAVFLTSQPTLTPTPSPTLTPSPTVTAAPLNPVATASGGGFDLAGLLQEARQSVSLNEWETAIETLDVILAADSSYEAAAVRSLMLQSLTGRALQLYRAGNVGDLAEANVLADRAEQFGDIGELSYERYIATLYLDALNTIGANYPAAITALREIYSQAPNYRDVTQLLFNQYVAYGDAWVAQTEFCPAAAQYQAALGILSSAEVNGKLTNAQTACAQATPLPGPDTTLTPGAGPTIAPVGQVSG
ncbi:MAG: hypothetical protein HXY41_11115 [Chloroflexi bacterium]|nr:hypothetical protein [Chloroflexota bacterium]